MPGNLEILNVQGGDVKINFDTTDCAEAIRAKRVITDMLRRGYALLVEVDGKFQRILEFDEKHGEYIVADFDPLHKVVPEEYAAVEMALQCGLDSPARPDAAPPESAVPRVVTLADGREGRLENGKFQMRKTSGKTSGTWQTVDGRGCIAVEIKKLLGMPYQRRGRRRLPMAQTKATAIAPSAGG